MLAVMLGFAMATHTTKPDLSWMTGAWGADAWGGRLEEHWTSQAGGTLLGMSRAVREGRTVHKEFIWIETVAQETDPVRYVTTLSVHVFRQPEETVRYRLTDFAAGRAVFQNPEHQRLHTMTYTRAGDALTVLLEGTRGGKPFRDEIRFSKTSLDRG